MTLMWHYLSGINVCLKYCDILYMSEACDVPKADAGCIQKKKIYIRTQ